MPFIKDRTNFELLRELKLAIKMGANPDYIILLEEEIYMRMEHEGVA